MLYVVFYNESENIVAYAGLDSSGKLINMANETISGTISLPEEMDAPAGGMNIVLYAYNQIFQSTSHVTIEEGEHEADYSIAVVYNSSFMPFSTMAESESENQYNLNDRNTTNHEMRPMGSESNAQGYQLYYQIFGSYSSDLITSGQYHGTIDLSEGSLSDINLQLERGQLISGTIKLPANQFADNDLYINVEAMVNSEDYSGYYIDPVLVLAGQNEASFSMVVPGQTSYLLQYYIYEQASHEEQVNGHLLRRGYYTASGASINEAEAKQIAVADAAISDIDFLMASGNQIWGTISLTDVQQFSQDIAVYVEAYASAYGYISEQYVIPEGSQSVDFALVVPASQLSLSVYADNDYKGDFPIDVSTGDYEFNREFSYWDTGEYSPEIITAPAVLIGNYALGLNSYYFGASGYISQLYNYSTNHIYLKSKEGLWFDLMNTEINSTEDLIADNAYNGSLPQINSNDSLTGILGVESWDNDGSLEIIFRNVPAYTIRIYDAAQGGILLGLAQSEDMEGSYVAQITITESDVDPNDLYVTFTPVEGIEQRRIPLNILYTQLP
jgi:hypothetical protein